MSQTVIGIFDNASEAQDAVEKLVKEGFDRSAIDISTTGSSNTSSSDFSSTGSGTIPATADTGSYGFGTSSTVDTGLSNYGTGSSSYGSSSSSDHKEGESKIGRFFRNLFGGDDDDNNNDNNYSRYSDVAEGRSIVTVHAKSADEAEDAADILDDYGAINIDEDTTGDAGTTGLNTNLQTRQSTGETASIPVIEEQLQVGKKTVETGGIRLRSRIVERPVEESLRLREERVYVDRTPVNRKVSATELENFQEGTIELTESAEVPVVAKEAYVKEEIRVGKDVNEREETIRDTVRSTEVDVENLKTDRTDSSSSSGTYNTGSSNL